MQQVVKTTAQELLTARQDLVPQWSTITSLQHKTPSTAPEVRKFWGNLTAAGFCTLLSCHVVTELVGGTRSFSSSPAALHAAPTPSPQRAHVCQCLGTLTPAAPNLWHCVHLSLHPLCCNSWSLDGNSGAQRWCGQSHRLQGQARLTTPSPSISRQSTQCVCRVQGTAFSVDILGYLRPLGHTFMAPTKADVLLDSRQPSPCIHKWVSVEITPLMDLHRRFELL